MEDKSIVEKLKMKLRSKNKGRADGRKAAVEKQLWKTNEERSYGGKTEEDAGVKIRREDFKKRKFLKSF